MKKEDKQEEKMIRMILKLLERQEKINKVLVNELTEIKRVLKEERTY